MSFKISGPAVGFDSSGKSVVSFDSPRNSILASIEAFVKFCGSVQLKEVTLPPSGRVELAIIHDGAGLGGHAR